MSIPTVVPKGHTVDPKLVASGLAMQVHARKCNKRLDECFVCQRNIQGYASIPATAIGKVLQDTMAGASHIHLAELVVTSMMARTFHKTERASRDFAASYPIMRAYEERGGRL